MKVYVLVEDFDNGEDYEDAFSYDGYYKCSCLTLEKAKQEAIRSIAKRAKYVKQTDITDAPKDLSEFYSDDSVYAYGFRYNDCHSKRDALYICRVLEEETR